MGGPVGRMDGSSELGLALGGDGIPDGVEDRVLVGGEFGRLFAFHPTRAALSFT